MKIRGDWEKFKCEGAYKISWGFEKMEGARLSGGLLQRGFSQNFLAASYLFPLKSSLFLSRQLSEMLVGFRSDNKWPF